MLFISSVTENTYVKTANLHTLNQTEGALFMAERFHKESVQSDLKNCHEIFLLSE